MIDFHNGSSSSTLTRRMLPFKRSKIKLITEEGMNRLWDWPRADGEMNFSVHAILRINVLQHFQRRKCLEYWNLQKTFSTAENCHPRAGLKGRVFVWSCHRVWRPLETSGFKMWVNFYLNRFWYTQDTSANFKANFINAIPGLQLWIVAEVCTQSLPTWRFPTQVQS